MEYKYLNHIDSPADLKKLPVSVLVDVCQELRQFIIEELSHNPGHLASSLGAIELTVALHYVFDTPQDKLIWDVGHQAYAHKILTGRREKFHTNRQFHGLAPFPTPAESEYDAFVSGHTSNSISAALGIEIAGEINQIQRNVVAIIGDGSMTGGLAFEGLNNTSMDKNNLLIVLNDNHMAIDPIQGGFTQYLVDLTTSERYNRWRWKLYRLALKMHLINENKRIRLLRVNNNLKTILTRQTSNIFQSMNIRYFGPADGHKVEDLVRILREIKNHKGPKVLHIITKKGKGYLPAENDQVVWHAPGEFNVATGERSCNQTSITQQAPLWQDVFGNHLLYLAKQNPKIVGITPAMPSGCSMCTMQRELPERVFDVGIAEGHALTFSAGLAKEGILPYCNVYSSFLQRAYDNIIHDVALPNLHVVLCIDRAGIVGNDGATHHGLLDMAYLRPIPNLIIGAPRVANDLRDMMTMAQDINAPIAIRYPRGRSVEDDQHAPVQLGKGTCLQAGTDLAVLTIGAIGNHVCNALHELSNEHPNWHIAHYDMRWLKPLDTELLQQIGQSFAHILTIEDGILNGGFGTAVMEYLSDQQLPCHVQRMGVNDQFVEHGSTSELYHMLGLDAEGIAKQIRQIMGSIKQS